MCRWVGGELGKIGKIGSLENLRSLRKLGRLSKIREFKEINEYRGVKDVKVDVDTKIVTVTYDPAKTNDDALVKAFTKIKIKATPKK